MSGAEIGQGGRPTVNRDGRGPDLRAVHAQKKTHPKHFKNSSAKIGVSGFEPETPRSQSEYSTRLSYTPYYFLNESMTTCIVNHTNKQIAIVASSIKKIPSRKTGLKG